MAVPSCQGKRTPPTIIFEADIDSLFKEPLHEFSMSISSCMADGMVSHCICRRWTSTCGR
ncbi:uncharacterized protein N7473_009462 [Penicillium subrubescens]|uniref:uncharacterized protein n=1 Tax=Penicillium subrubescens TaxID=1316194 RepID=UPI002544DF29|nr:uncharacterized protein N7473_009462 [Penicillium subrubescens]KAJ5886788.1 hypothetical protein N7473_009462 [Penicillium subrubescens]